MRPRLSLESLEVLDSIDRKGSFAAAAADLYRVPSAVTYSVQKMEEDLGITLFRKEGRRSVLTPAGRVLLEQGRDLLLAADRLVENVRQVERGWESTLSIAVDSVLPMDNVLSRVEVFYREQPDIEINLYEEVLAGTWEAVIEGRADLALGAPAAPATTQGLDVHPMGAEEWVFAVAPDHPLARLERALNREDIAQYKAIVVRDSSRQMPAMSVRILEKQCSLYVATVQQKIEAQLRGLGVGFLPRNRIEPLLSRGQLVALEAPDDAPQVPLHIVHKKSSRGRALRWFVDAFSTAEDSPGH